MHATTQIRVRHLGPLDRPRVFATSGVAALLLQLGLAQAAAAGEGEPMDTNRDVGFLAAQAIHCALALGYVS